MRYYANDMVSRLTQGTTQKNFTLDPVARARTATDTTNGTTTRTITNHYPDPGDSPAWIAETAGATSTWVRTITGIGGGLVGLQRPAGTVLQLANPHGDIVATANDTTTATGPSGYFEQTEYGAPRAGNAVNPDRYGWLGTHRRSTDTLAGLTLMGVRLYNPTSGRFLSTDPIPGGNANPYTYPTDPTNAYDLDGRECSRLLCGAGPGRMPVGARGGTGGGVYISNNVLGNIGEATLRNQVAQAYRGNMLQIREQMRVWTPNGFRVVDVAVKDLRGNWRFFESKVNSGARTASQRAKDAFLNHLGYRTTTVRYRIDRVSGKVISGGF